MRALQNGIAAAFQAAVAGSIPAARSGDCASGPIAQRSEQPAHNRSVRGSNPRGPTSLPFLERPAKTQIPFKKSPSRGFFVALHSLQTLAPLRDDVLVVLAIPPWSPV